MCCLSIILMQLYEILMQLYEIIFKTKCFDIIFESNIRYFVKTLYFHYTGTTFRSNAIPVVFELYYVFIRFFRRASRYVPVNDFSVHICIRPSV